MLEPCFFDKNRLFGTYHPTTDGGSDKLLVICPPLFDEYRRCYRALAELAKGCAADGTHVFRFDYFGTGESWGELEGANIEGWINDIRAAIEEGIALSGASQVYLLGVRFGGTLAAQVQHPQIAEYLFWDLVGSGADYLKHLKRVDDDLEQFHRDSANYLGISPGSVAFEQFQLSSALKDEIGRVNADLATLRTRARVHRVVSNEAVVGDDAEFSGFAYDWPTTHEGLLLPKPVLETIARRVA
jgi:pimeloyl-ACP methyl ester carboxylesterase